MIAQNHGVGERRNCQKADISSSLLMFLPVNEIMRIPFNKNNINSVILESNDEGSVCGSGTNQDQDAFVELMLSSSENKTSWIHAQIELCSPD
ncbi:hypothetical protein [Beijerinckia indica]|uniref:hypothetical protein n=1 Tax=Beijerinckia indica TaxID=533 RepID=UPI0011D1371C|nr:hypothetical protein [Beijerinckia indica]